MKRKNSYATADVIVERDKKVLLVKRKYEPFTGIWALPGGHLDCGKETLEKTAIRELSEETGILVKEEDLKFFGVYSEPNRDPRGHYITHVYVVRNSNGQPVADDDAKDARFFPLESLPELAFDHKRILQDFKIKNKGDLK
jgi:8-oxo-dGTP diphosphatase